MDSAAANTANTIHLSLSGLSGRLYHLITAQTVSAVKKVDIAYTSPSTALNQIEVLKAVANPATKPDAANGIFCSSFTSVSLPTSASLERMIVDQQTNVAAKYLARSSYKISAKSVILQMIIACDLGRRASSKMQYRAPEMGVARGGSDN